MRGAGHAAGRLSQGPSQGPHCRKSGMPWDFYSVGNQERLKVFLGKASVEKGRPGDIVEGGRKEGPETGFRRRVRRESLIGLGRQSDGDESRRGNFGGSTTGAGK